MTGIELEVDEEIGLRQFSVDDIEDIFALIDMNREHLSQNGDNTAEKYPDRESVLKSIVAPPNPSRLRFGIWANGIYVGTINITPEEGDECAEIGYYLGSEFTGRGYMTRSVDRVVRYGFDDLGVSEIYGKVHKNNHSSASVLTKCGFSVNEGKSTGIEFYFSICE